MRYVIALDTALRLVRDRVVLPKQHSIVAPTLLRSEILASLYRAVRDGEFDRREAAARLDHMRALKIRLLGDRVVQKVAWDLAEELGWEDTGRAEYLALTRLQADAFVSVDAALARSVRHVVPLATYRDMTNPDARE